MLKARKSGYWGGGPYLEHLEFIDLGDDPAAQVAALARKQVDMVYQGGDRHARRDREAPHVQLYQVDTA